MKRAALLAALPATLLAGAAPAQELPALDPRIVSVAAEDGGPIRLNTAPDMTQTVLFAPDERIVSVILSDPGAFLVNVAGSGDSLALRAAGPSSLAVMSVRTSLRPYEFELVSGRSGAVPAVVRLVERGSIPRAEERPAPPDTGAHFTYRLSGKDTLLPTSISDDGQKTYIEWAGDKAIPATFALGPTGTEQMVDGYMRGGIYTIDRVYETLIFRIDKDMARARRQAGSGGHG